MEKINTQSYNTNDQIDNSTYLVEILFQYLRHWKWFIVSFVLALFIALAVILVSTHEYNPSLSILLNEDKTSRGPSSDFIDMESLGFMSTTNNIENEIIVLSSPDLMEKVAKSLYLSVAYYQKKNLRDVEIYKRTPIRVSSVSGLDTFVGECDFYIQKTDAGYEIKGGYIVAKVKTEIDTLVNKLPIDLKLNESIALNIDLSGEEIVEQEKYYVKVRDIETTTYNLASKLSVVTASPKSSALMLSIMTNNTVKGIDILNELVHQYNEENTKLNNEIAFNTALFINERLKEISVELSDAETEVVQYKQHHNIADLSSEAQLFVSQTGENERNLMEAETQLNVLRYIQNFIDNPANRTKIIPNMGIADVGLSQIIQEYNAKLLASDQLLKGTGEKNPARVRVIEELDNMIVSISGSLNSVKEAYTVSRNDLQRQSYTTQSRIRSVPKQEKGLIEKVREQKIKENLFLFLMQKREETNLSIAATSKKARIITSPQTKLLPIAPKSKIILLAFGILGLLVPIIIIYVINLLKINISSRDDFERMSSVPVIGEVLLKEQGDFIIANKPNDVAAEMFRSLRNNIRFASTKNTGLTILTTSTIANEGKTFVSINLALSFATTKKKVLIIGGDIRNPSVHTHLKLDSAISKKGLSDYLITENKDWRDYLITPYSEFDNFQVIPAGAIPPNPNELLLSLRLKELIESTQKEFDYIIIDSAPVGLVSDSYLIGEYIDLTLYLVRENKTPKAAINFINMQKNENKLQNIYVVFNRAELGGNYKYGYGKEYGYGAK